MTWPPLAAKLAPAPAADIDQQRRTSEIPTGSSKAGNTRQIDRLVYELYGLTEAEIAIVEGAE